MVIEKDGDTAVVKLPQRCEGKFHKELFESVMSEENRRIAKLICDFTETRFIDSSTVGILVTLDKEFRANGSQIVFRNLGEELSELFSDTGLDLLFTIETNGSVREARVNLFEQSVDIRLDAESTVEGDVFILHLSGVMNHPVGSRFF